MNRRLNRALILLPVIGTFSITIAQAQNQQQFLPNVESNIQNDINSGAVNSNQAKQLQNRAASIQSQELQDMSRNGGALTPQQQNQINRETEQLKQSTHRDMRRDNPNANVNPNWRPPFQQQPGYNGQYNPNWQQQQQQQLQQQQLQQQQWLQSHPNAQANPNDIPYRHHHRWNQQSNPQ